MDIKQATQGYEARLASRVTLIPADLELKHQRMAESPFPFLRATFYRWVQRWPEACPDLATASAVLSVGDLHVDAREAKALTVSACLWANEAGGADEILYQKILDAAVRMPDPWVRICGSWIVRRLAPDCSRVELAALPKNRDEQKLLRWMGEETRQRVGLFLPRDRPDQVHGQAGRIPVAFGIPSCRKLARTAQPPVTRMMVAERSIP